MSKIKPEYRKTDIRVLAQVECNRLRTEGYTVPRAIWHKIPLYDTMDRQTLRRLLLEVIGNGEA